MNFCSNCGKTTIRMIPQGDNRERVVCSKCKFIHYENPRIVAGCIVLFNDKVLLCRRAIEPRIGLWTVPAGYMENGETVAEAALRETWEEARTEPVLEKLYVVTSIPKINQVYMLYLAFLDVEKHDPGPESLETRFFSTNQIPWNNLAFPTVFRSLKCLINDLKKKSFSFHISD